MSMRELYIHYEDSLVCSIEEDKEGVLVLHYTSDWCETSEAFPLSLALKLQKEPYRGRAVTAFIENLLPEGEQRKQIEHIAELPDNDDIAFLERFGEDCAGALTVSRFATKQRATPHVLKEHTISYESVEHAVKNGQPVQLILEEDGELPPFSLAGAQAKFPCIVRDNALILPRSGEPTTHIVKLPIRAGDKLLDSVENEYLCMQFAKKSGLNVPDVRLLGRNMPLFAIERFDRTVQEGQVKRLHTQDICQALGRLSKEKYERHGGPSFASCYELIRDNSSHIPTDVLSLLDWLGFNLAIGNNDSHAKNLSLMLGMKGLQLAPYYDLICTALYKQYSPNFAFRIGTVSSWDKVSYKQLEGLAKSANITASLISKRWQTLFQKMEAAWQEIKETHRSHHQLKKTLGKIDEELGKRLATLRKNIGK
jgi:serine/threonine-protein kinase HipA